MISFGGKPPKKKAGPPPDTFGASPEKEKGNPFSKEEGEEKKGGKVSKEEAGFRAADAICGNCSHFNAGECVKVDVECESDDTCDLFEEEGEGGFGEEAEENEESE
jgi:hypothetical protein